MLVDELAEVLVGRDHVGGEFLPGGLAREGADDVVGFVAIEFEDGQVEGADESLDVGDGGAEVLGHFLALGFVGGKFLVSRGGHGGVEDNGEMGGRLLGEEFEEGVGEAVNRGGVAARRRADGFVAKAKWAR